MNVNIGTPLIYIGNNIHQFKSIKFKSQFDRIALKLIKKKEAFILIK